jgi:hypothetical protein
LSSLHFIQQQYYILFSSSTWEWHNSGIKSRKTTYMRFIPTKVHGYLDYAVGLLLIVAPWLLDFARGGAETWVPVALGASAIIYSLITDYELGAFRQISMRTHLGLDLFSGIFLAASPWLFGFADYVYLPHLILGILEIGASLMTKTTPSGTRNSTNTSGASTTRTANV